MKSKMNILAVFFLCSLTGGKCSREDDYIDWLNQDSESESDSASLCCRHPYLCTAAGAVAGTVGVYKAPAVRYILVLPDMVWFGLDYNFVLFIHPPRWYDMTSVDLSRPLYYDGQ